ncbi:MAG: DUF393 domain-containing protein [Caulobacter sp.]
MIIYDGDCVFCQNYVRFIRLKDTVGPVEMINARSDDPRVELYWREGFNLDEGMLFVYGGRVLYGSEAVRVLADLSSGEGWFNRLNKAALSNPLSAQLAYPLLKIGRRLTLLARGKRPLVSHLDDLP